MKHLKLFFALFAMLALGVGNAWGAEEEVSLSNGTHADSKITWTAASGNITITQSKGSSGTAVSSSYVTAPRVYKGHILSFEAKEGYKIKQIDLKYNGTYYGNSMTAGTVIANNNVTDNTSEVNRTWSTASNGTHIVSSVSSDGLSAIHIQNVATTNVQLRLTAIKITYVEGTSTPTTTYTIKWHTAKGITTDVTLNEGATITKPATDPTMSGYVFMGWTEDCEVASDGAGFTAIENFGTATEDKAFYAVFAKATTTGGGGSTTGSKTLVSYSESSYYTDGAITGVTGSNSASWTADAFNMVQKKNSSSNAVALNYAEIRVYASHSLVFTPSTGSTITSIVATATTSAYANALGGSSVENCTKSVSTSTVTITPTDGTKAITITNSAQSRLKTIVVNYTTSGGGTTTYSDYVTTCASGIEYVELGDDFKWSATEAEVTIDATDNEFPTLTNTHNVPVKYSSSDDAIATIADGTVTLKKEGTVTITAKYEGGTSAGTGKEYKAKTVTYSLKVNKAVAQPTGTMYVKVTDAITDGEYLIVYEAGNVAFDGSLATLDVAGNMIEAQINSNTIAGNTEIDAATFTIASMEGGHSIQSKSGTYIGRTASGNGMNTGSSAILNIISITGGAVTVAGSGSGASASLQYFAQSGSERFRYYTSAQKAIALYKKVDPNAVVEPVFTLAAGEYYGTQSVEITCATTGAEIYYTLNGTDPTSASTKYTGAISIASTTTVKAIAVKGANSSAVVSATYTILAPLATMQAIFDKATAVGETATPVHITMNNWVVTGVKNNNVYVTDGTKGLIIYTASHGFNVGDILSGTVACKVQLYNGSSELTELTSTTEGLTVTTGGVVTPAVVNDVTTLSGVNTGAVVKITGTCTQESSKYYVAGVQLYNSLFEFTNPTVGNKYNVTGVYLQYNSTKEILPRQQEDIEEVVDALPSATISIANITMEVGEEKTIEATITPVDAPITYETTATCITLNGTTITAVSEGTATITASIAEKAGEYTGVTKTFTVTVNAPNIATLPFEFNNGKADIENTLGMSQNGLGSDYGSAPLLKFDGTGDYVIIHFNGEPGKLSYNIKGNSYSGGTFIVQESADGSAYTNIVEYTELGSTETKTHTLSATSRYVKFIYTEKVNGNVALGNIKIALPEEEPGEGGGETPEERLTDWVLTPLADITTNDLVVITMTKGETTWAMTNDKGTTAAPVASVVTLSADALAAEPDANLKWVVSNDNGTLTIYPYGTYETWLYCTNANNGVRVGTGVAKEFTIDTDHLYTTLTDDPRYLGVYDADADTWRCYTSINSNIEGQTLAFYVKKNANDVLPGTGEDPEGGEGGEDPVVPTPTINATATFIFNTAEGLNDLGIAYPATPTTAEDGTEDAFKTEFENNATFTQDGITMTTTGGTVVATRVWLTAAGKLDLRVYKGATLTFSVPAEHKISKVVFDGTNISHLLVNGNAVSGNAWTGSAQTITFTAKDDAKTIKINTIAFVVEYTRDVTNTYGTICLPHASASTSGAYFYEVVGKGTENGKPAVYLASVNSLKAGVPYIFEKTANTIKVVYSSEQKDTPQNANGLVGNFTNEFIVPVDNYILYKDAFIPADGTTNKVNAYRAYLNLADIDGGAPTQMPGRRYIGMSVQGENEATGFDNIQLPNANSQKLIINGQLIIIRDGEMYNAQGQSL